MQGNDALYTVSHTPPVTDACGLAQTPAVTTDGAYGTSGVRYKCIDMYIRRRKLLKQTLYILRGTRAPLPPTQDGPRASMDTMQNVEGGDVDEHTRLTAA